MATKIKGICKGFKYISHFFVVKEREMDIGHPTDVKHVAHIGWDSQSTNAPTWMNEFKTSSGYSAMSIGSIGGETDPSFVPISSWSSQDFDHSMVRQPASEMFNDTMPKDLPKAPKKQKRKKSKSTSSPKSTSSSRSSRAPKTSFAATVAEMEITPHHQGLLL